MTQNVSAAHGPQFIFCDSSKNPKNIRDVILKSLGYFFKANAKNKNTNKSSILKKNVLTKHQAHDHEFFHLINSHHC